MIETNQFQIGKKDQWDLAQLDRKGVQNGAKPQYTEEWKCLLSGSVS